MMPTSEQTDETADGVLEHVSETVRGTTGRQRVGGVASRCQTGLRSQQPEVTRSSRHCPVLAWLPVDGAPTLLRRLIVATHAVRGEVMPLSHSAACQRQVAFLRARSDHSVSTSSFASRTPS